MRFNYILFILFLIVLSCSQDSKEIDEVNIMDSEVRNNLKTLEEARIYFGHQSVGYNILDGVEGLMKEANYKSINIIEVKEGQKLPEYYFTHSKAGKNTDPDSKCNAFSNILKEDFAGSLDIAFLKFCYVDIREQSDVQAIFNYYKATMDSIKSKYPNLKLIHITVPLTTLQSGWKAVVKKIIGREISGYTSNVKRNQYNNLLKEIYKNEPIFDLAKVESIYPDGRRHTFEKDGKSYYAMVPAYTYDNGHLNELGRKLAANELIRVLAETIRNKIEVD